MSAFPFVKTTIQKKEVLLLFVAFLPRHGLRRATPSLRGLRPNTLLSGLSAAVDCGAEDRGSKPSIFSLPLIIMNLKKVIFILISFSFAFNSSSCFKNRRQIRVRNNYATPLTVKVGPADFGSVPSVKTTEYKEIPKGKSEITGDVPGSIDVPSGKHKYTLNINTEGIVTLIEEGK